jgi:hypothetical protein
MTSAIKITYWAEQKQGSASIYDFEGIGDFRKELDESYISVVQGRPGPLGGLHELAVEFISNLTLVEVAKFLLEGIAFDLIKSGTRAFVLRPFLKAYQKLKDRNPSFQLDIEEFRIVFQDSVIVIYKITGDSIFVNLEKIIKADRAGSESNWMSMRLFLVYHKRITSVYGACATIMLVTVCLMSLRGCLSTINFMTWIDIGKKWKSGGRVNEIKKAPNPSIQPIAALRLIFSLGLTKNRR